MATEHALSTKTKGTTTNAAGAISGSGVVVFQTGRSWNRMMAAAMYQALNTYVLNTLQWYENTGAETNGGCVDQKEYGVRAEEGGRDA